MGDRVSVSFSNEFGEGQSVTIFNHWGGEEFVDVVKRFLHELSDFLKKDKNPISDPLYRLEPETVAFNFIGYLCKQEEPIFVRSSLYIGKTPLDGDNSDNGHYDFRVRLDDSKNIIYTIVRSYNEYICFDQKA